MAESRTEQPTRRRIHDARQRGQVVHSREVDTALVLLAAIAGLRFAGGRLWAGMERLLVDGFAQLNRDPLNTELTAMTGTQLILRAALLLLPVLLPIAAISLLGGFLQTGGAFSHEALKPQLSRLNPLKGAQRMFASKQSLAALAKSLVKLGVVGGVAAQAVRARMGEITALGVGMGLEDSVGALVDIAFDVAWKVTLVLVALAAADYLFQRSDLLGQLRMTRQEVKDELRHTEGDPQVRGRMAQLRRSFLARVMQAVPHADVVLVNPTTYAVALKYDATADSAPRVIAKGERLVAQRIRERAMELGIPVITNPPLTRAIYRAVAVGQQITPDLYEAVAEVLAFVYRLRHPRARTAA